MLKGKTAIYYRRESGLMARSASDLERAQKKLKESTTPSRRPTWQPRGGRSGCRPLDRRARHRRHPDQQRGNGHVRHRGGHGSRGVAAHRSGHPDGYVLRYTRRAANDTGAQVRRHCRCRVHGRRTRLRDGFDLLRV